MSARRVVSRRGWSSVRWLAMALVLAVPLRTASAHGRLLKADPAPGAHVRSSPTQLVLTFSEVPSVPLSRIYLFNATKQPVALGTLTADPTNGLVVRAKIGVRLATGRYTVRWRMAGADGHPVGGEYAFTVEAATLPDGAVGATSSRPMSAASASMTPRQTGVRPEVRVAPLLPVAIFRDTAVSAAAAPAFDASSWEYVAIRAVQFVSIVLLIGVLAMHVVVLPRLHRAGRGDAAFLAEARRRALPWSTRAVWAFGAATGARLGAQHLAVFGADDGWTMESVRALLLQSSWGSAWWVAVAGTGLGVWALRRVATDRAHGWSLLGVAIVAMAGTLSYSGHPAAATHRTAALVTDLLHLLGAGGWVGSLALLVLAGMPAALAVGETRAHAVIAGLVAEFSLTALVFASLLAITGVIAGWRNVGSWSGLWGSGYGQMLLAKLAVLSVAAGTGAYNWRRVLPALGTPVATARLRRSAAVELAAAVVVLCVTAVLVATPLPMESVPH